MPAEITLLTVLHAWNPGQFPTFLTDPLKHQIKKVFPLVEFFPCLFSLVDGYYLH